MIRCNVQEFPECFGRSPFLGLGQRQHPGCSAEAYRRHRNDAPSIGAYLDRAPSVIAEVNVDAPFVLAHPEKYVALRTAKACSRIDRINRRLEILAVGCRVMGFVVGPAQPVSAT